MLRIIRSMSEVKFADLMYVYSESNLLNGNELYPFDSRSDQRFRAEQDFYNYLFSVFFKQRDSFIAVWETPGGWVSALRIEPYTDGYLLCGLETAPDARRQGYAKLLIQSLLEYLKEQGSGVIYSHVSKKNTPSLAVHSVCGFSEVKDCAVYSDGSVMHNCVTMAYVYQKSEI